MAALYGSKFADMWRGTDPEQVKALWAHELGKLSRDEVTKGAQALMTQEWPPSLPQFIKLCRIQIDPQKAFVEALNGLVARDRGEVGVWSHPAIFWATTRIGAFDMKNSTYPQIQARWTVALEDELAKKEWAEIPKPALAIPVEKAAANVAEKYLAQLQDFKAESTGVDHKRWAKKIMARHEAGDKSLLPIQIKFAKEALNAKT
jgi:hypothetical protein